MKTETIQQRVDEYLKLYDDIKDRTGDERIALSILQEVNKDIRMAQIREERENGNDKPATEKQLNYLKKLGVDVSVDLTKKQASALIDEALEKESEQDSFRVALENITIPWHSVDWI